MASSAPAVTCSSSAPLFAGAFPAGSSTEASIESSIVVENLHLSVTEDTISSGLSQFGNVVGVDFAANPLRPSRSIGRAIVVFESVKEARNVLRQAGESLLLLGSVPRPVSIRPATAEDLGVPARNTRKIKHPLLVRAGRARGLLKLRNLLYEHLMQVRTLEQAQCWGSETLHLEQEEDLKNSLKLKNEVFVVRAAMDDLARAYTGK